MNGNVPGTLREIAALQHGVVSRQQALRAGLSADVIKSKIRNERWQHLQRGAYALFTGPPDRGARLWAAVLSAGPGAVLSHQTAAELQQLDGGEAPTIHVTVPTERRVRAAPGLVVYRSARVAGMRFPPGALPQTWIEDTILDLTQSAETFDDACRWVTRAFGKGLTNEGKLRAALRQRRKLRWRSRLDELITAAAGGAHSVLEFRYDRDVERAHRLPESRRQVPFAGPGGNNGFRDRYYDRYGVIVELDGNEAHPAEDHWKDKTRDNAAAAHGKQSLRYGWKHVRHEACDTAAEIAAVLRRRGWDGWPRPCSRACAIAKAER
ncbi:MAG: hypothetical protein JOY82_26010 [Streptosporangiaceae bacterium]|nr:hypothetical protein [Streptosporangiaceae bacterium]MBV9857941.1 hypothetical protein [Streptosporangiaceae bacterium]